MLLIVCNACKILIILLMVSISDTFLMFINDHCSLVVDGSPAWTAGKELRLVPEVAVSIWSQVSNICST